MCAHYRADVIRDRSAIEDVKQQQQQLSKNHMDSCLKLSTFWRVNIATQLHEGYRLAVHGHKYKVSKIYPELADSLCEVLWDFELALKSKQNFQELSLTLCNYWFGFI